MKHVPLVTHVVLVIVVHTMTNPCRAQMSTGEVVHMKTPSEERELQTITPWPQSLQLTEQISEHQGRWRLATKRKWMGFGISAISAAALIKDGPSTLVSGGYLVGGLLSLVGIIGEDIHKHRYARAVSKHFKSLESKQSQKQSPGGRDEQIDFLIPPPNYRPCDPEDLKSGAVVWFKEEGSLVLAVGQIVSTVSRGTRLYVTVKQERHEKTMPIGDIFIPL